MRKNKILTIPNILSFFRLALIPVFVWAYCGAEQYGLTAALLVISGVTDVLDGFIARHFDMVSDLGKALDPVADKLTQLAMLVCLVTRFPLMLIPLIVLLVKEIASGIMGLVVIRKTGAVHGAVWHGKVTTVLLYLTMVVHVLWYKIPELASDCMIFACVGMMVLSMVLYSLRNVRLIKSAKTAAVLPDESAAAEK